MEDERQNGRCQNGRKLEYETQNGNDAYSPFVENRIQKGFGSCFIVFFSRAKHTQHAHHARPPQNVKRRGMIS